MKPGLNCLYIYLTDECNLKCIHCWQSAPLSGKGKYSRLDFNECKKFLDEAIELGLKSIIFSGGEPLLNPGLKKFAEYFYKKSIRMTIETNGILISDRKILNTIKKYKIYCAISLDGVNPVTHNNHRGIKNAFEQTVKSLEKLEQEKIYYQIIMAISKFNYQELIPLLDWIKEKYKYCEKFKINIVNQLGRAAGMDKKGLLFRPEEYPKITEDLSGIFDHYPFKVVLHIDPVFFSFKNLMSKYSCGGHCGYKSSLSILANGSVSICSLGKQFDKYIFGHVSTIDVKGIWESHPILIDIHESTHTKLKGICSNCIFRQQCLGSCRAEALCVYGDFFEPHPRCQEYYDSGKLPKSRLINQDKEIKYL
jgi:SynChlorMet cassette radical SAM/SPASM protein ScmF